MSEAISGAALPHRKTIPACRHSASSQASLRSLRTLGCVARLEGWGGPWFETRCCATLLTMRAEGGCPQNKKGGYCRPFQKAIETEPLRRCPGRRGSLDRLMTCEIVLALGIDVAIHQLDHRARRRVAVPEP